MIRSALIENFQSHSHSVLKFDPGVNVIVGRSDSGKSAVLRALYWALFNRPTGDAFVSDWGGSAEVHLEFDDGQLARIKNKSFNGYILGMHDEYTGFGVHVPEPVSEFINMTRINFQHQMDTPFMLSWSPGDRGAFINEITNLQVMDRAVTNIKRSIRHRSQNIDGTRTLVEDLERDLTGFEDLDDIEQRVEALEQIECRIEKLENSRETLKDLIRTLEKAQSRIDSTAEVLKVERSVEQLCKDQHQIEQLKEQAEDLADCVSDLESEDRQIKAYDERLNELEEEFHELMPDECPLCGTALEEK